MLRHRLCLEIQDKGDFSENQFGFRTGRSTVQAVKSVMAGAGRQAEKYCLLVTLAVKNA